LLVRSLGLLFNPEDGGIMFLRNVGILPDYTSRTIELLTAKRTSILTRISFFSIEIKHDVSETASSRYLVFFITPDDVKVPQTQ
jgi:hypothetical protein